MSEKLLSEYQGVLRELEMIKNRVAVIKDVTQDRLKCAQSEEEKDNIFIDFKTQLNKIKKDKNIKHKYKDLVKRKETIESEMLDKMSDENPKQKKQSTKKKEKVKDKVKEKVKVKELQIIKRKKHIPLEYIQEVVEISEEFERPCYVKPSDDVNKDINELISKYKKEVDIESDCISSDHSSYSRYSRSSCTSTKPAPKQCKTKTIVVQVPSQPCQPYPPYPPYPPCPPCPPYPPCPPCKQSSKKTPFIDSCSEKSEGTVIVKKKPPQPQCKKNDIDDTKQVKKLCNLIKSLQCKIDE
jgi:hypothetical protein